MFRLSVPLLCLALLLNACANHMTLKRETNVKSSNTIFLRPTMDKSVYVEIRNTSDNPHATLLDLPARLQAKGYTIVQDPDKAHYTVQVTTVFAAKAKPGATIDSLIAGGFGGMIGGSIGAASALGSRAGYGWIPGGAAIGAAAGLVGSKLTEDEQMSLVVDTQIIERTKELVEQTLTSQTTPGTGMPTASTGLFNLGGPSVSPPHAGDSVESSQETRRGYERLHKNRSAAMAQEMWMNEKDAVHDLVLRLTESISGLF